MKVNWNDSCTCTSRPRSRGYTSALVALAGAAAIGMTAGAQVAQTQVNSPNAGVNNQSHPAITGELGGNVSHGQAIPYEPGASSGTGQSVVTIVADGVSHEVDVTCEPSIGDFGDAANVVLNVDVGSGAHVTAIGFDVQLEAFDPSWLSELRVEMTNTGITAGVGLTPGTGDDAPGQAAYSSGGLVDLVELELDFNVDADGNVRVELWDTFVDFPGEPDGTWGWDCDGDPGPGPDSNCCEANGSPGCDDPDCEATVCAEDSFCCDTEWDSVCGDLALANCDVCQDDPEPEPSDCCEANGTPGCDDPDCEATVCAEDSFCCETEWDGICADLAVDLCDVCQDDPDPEPSDCCEANGTPGCDDPDCEAAVCAADSFCCETEWDGLCADAASELCDICEGDDPVEGCGEPGTGNCCEATGTPFCEDEECCTTVCNCDPFCCETEWDTFCAGQGFEPGCGAELLCPDCEPGTPAPCVDGVGDCCVDHGGVGCEDEECCTQVCLADAFCCDSAWDGLCADAAADVCEVCDLDLSCGDPAAGDCCEATGTPFCDDAECCNTVCDCDPFCCDTEWDTFCAGEGFEPGCGAQILCDCEVPPVCPDDATGDCCADHGGLGCEDDACCDQICTRDPFCCETAWDGLCADAANEQCDICLEPEDPESCGNGFWKNHSANAPGNQPDLWEGYSADDLFADVFATVPDDDDDDNGNGDSNCCIDHGGLGCDDPDCEALICGQDAFCCDVAWDGLCADAANEQCDVCSDAVAAGSANLQGVGAVGNGVPSSTTGATIVDFDVTGIESIEAFGNALNEVFNLDVGANAHVTGVGWDVTIEAFDPSWLSEIRVEFTDTDITGGVGLSVGVGDDAPGTASYSSDGILDLVGEGLDFNVAADGNLRLEFWETFVDFPGEPDGMWVSGTLSFEIGGDGGDPGPGPDSNCCTDHGGLGCDDPDCEALICGQDAFCCDSAWDGLCADAANEQCEVCQDDNGDDPDSNCCTDHGGLGCDDPDCEALICGQDAFCCDVAWDGLCADAANEQCDVCQDGGGDPDPEPEPHPAFGDCTLHDVISAPAGGPMACSNSPHLNNLGRFTVGALLNAAHSEVNYPFSEDEVISMFQDAYDEWQDTGDHEVLNALKEEFASAGEAGCPLDGDADVNGDGMINADDLLQVLGAWGNDCRLSGCPEDINNDTAVDSSDMLEVLNQWGQ